jgi:hypothetical protein
MTDKSNLQPDVATKSITTTKPGKRKMRPGGGKSKGSNFEGQVAKKLSAALAPLSFIRSPGSGARLGGKNFEKFGEMFGADAMAIFVADVVPVNEKKESLNFLHSIECKSYKSPDTFTQLASTSANLFKWFEESVVDAAKTDKNPILIFKWNNTPVYVAVNPLHKKYDVSTTIKPKFSIDYEMDMQPKRLSIYLFDELCADSSFWVKKGI